MISKKVYTLTIENAFLYALAEDGQIFANLICEK